MTPARFPRQGDRVRAAVAGQPLDGEILHVIWGPGGDALACGTPAGDRFEVPLHTLRWDRRVMAWVGA